MIILLNIFAWVSIHLFVSYITSRMTPHQLQKLSAPFQPLQMEAGGGMYRFVRIQKWKKHIPDAGGWFPGGLNKNDIGLFSHQGRVTFLNELNRAELSHWLQMLPAPFFYILNNGVVSWVMFIYGILFNLPLILVQRYNRMRIVQIMVQHALPEELRPPGKTKTPHF
ncbi:hypothetical protein [Rossellomorea aquimaris]|uniref:glycosyl-4,4'-diaponeurosporenoate acyltransferase CrtO family protein n=1 Tax=Rossellomorea aquimaris TaxID=189382 RepID=UPI0005C9A8EE